MKKISYLGISLLLCGMAAGSFDISAQDVQGVTLEAFTIKAGETKTVKVNKQNVDPTDYTGFQMTITAPEGLTIDEIKKNDGYPSSFTFITADNAQGGKTVMLASTPVGTEVPSTDITDGILELTVTASKTVTNQKTGNLTLTNIIFTSTDVNNLKTTYADVTCQVTYENVPASEVVVTPGTDPDDPDPDDPYDPDDPDPEKPNPNDPDYPKHENWGANGIYEIYVDETVVFTAKTDDNATLQGITWTPSESTSDLQIETDGSTLKITGKQISTSETTFTATSEYINVTGEIKVKVVAMPVMRVYINSQDDKNDVDIDGTLQLTASVYPSAKYTGDVIYTWSISENTYATIGSTNGTTTTVTGVAPGEATVTVSAQSTGAAKTATVEVTVNPIKPESVEIHSQYDKITDRKTLKVGETLTLTADVLPEETSHPALEWTVSDGGVLSSSTDGEIVVTALKEGTATVTATVISTKDDANPVKGTFEITVSGNPLYGDAADDGSVDLVDAMAVAYYIIDQIIDNFCYINANVIQDEQIDIADYDEILLIAAGISENYVNNEYVGTSYTYTSNDRLIAENFTVGNNGAVEIGVSLENQSDYKSLQADIFLPEGMTVTAVETGEAVSEHSLLYNVNSENILKIVIISPQGNAFKASETPLFTIHATADANCGSVDVENVIALDTDSNKCSLGSESGANSSEAGVGTLETSAGSVNSGKGFVEISGNVGEQISVYTLDGRLVKNVILNDAQSRFTLEKGIYLVRIGSETQRVVVR